MKGRIPFHALVEALSGAVIEAQDRINLHQIASIRGYFDEDNRPRSVSFRLPSLHPDASEGDEDLYRAPLLPLVSTNHLRIKDVEISFEADLGELAGEEAAPDSQAAPVGSAWEAPRLRSPRIGLDTAVARQRGNVRVVLRVEGTEPTDGAARLINQLAQSQGVFKTIKAT